MATKEEKKHAFNELQKYSKEIAELRNGLNSINDSKESFFGQKDRISSEIRSLIKKVRESKSERDSLTKEVRELKAKRTKLSDEIKKKIEEAKKLNSKKEDIRKKHKFQIDPSRLKEEIEKLELRIETEGMTFPKEQEIMKQIKEKKKLYGESKDVSDVFGSISSMNGEISRLKKEAEEAHKEVQSKAEKSQQLHEQMIEASKKIDELKKSEQELNGRIGDIKKKFDDANIRLQTKLSDAPRIKHEAESARESAREDSRRGRKGRDSSRLKEKSRLVQEKLRKGEKLTTEDLIVMGGIEDTEDFGEEKIEDKKTVAEPKKAEKPAEPAKEEKPEAKPAEQAKEEKPVQEAKENIPA